MRHVDCVHTSTFTTSFIFSSMSTLFGCKVEGIFSARTLLKLLASLGEEEKPVQCLWMFGAYFLAKNFKTFLKSHHNSSHKKKKKNTLTNRKEP